MGKRKKSARKPGAGRVKTGPLETTFSCLFCNHDKSVTCKMDKAEGLGHLTCKICGQKFSCQINYLADPVDVYSEWIDEADKLKEKRKPAKRRPEAEPRPAARAGPIGGDDDDDDDDDFSD